MADKIIKISEGDCISSIAFNNGISDWKKLYDYQEQKFKDSRKNPNSLNKGDQIKIPLGKELSDTKPIGSVVKVTIASPKTVRLRLVVIDNTGKPLNDKSYTLMWAVGVLSWGTKKGKTAANGLIETDIPANSRLAKLRLDLTVSPPAPVAAAAGVADPKKYPPVIKVDDFSKVGENVKPEYVYDWELTVGSLPSPNTDEGTKSRLENLGYVCVGGNTIADVVKTFQKRNKLSVTGSISDVNVDVSNKHDKL